MSNIDVKEEWHQCMEDVIPWYLQKVNRYNDWLYKEKDSHDCPKNWNTSTQRRNKESPIEGLEFEIGVFPSRAMAIIILKIILLSNFLNSRKYTKLLSN